jgi:adenylate kinase family enzyme
MQRIVIIGNSGSGKSYLTRQLGARLSLPPIHLDEWFWEPGGFTVKRPQDAVFQQIATAKQAERWIAEGVYGELTERFFSRAEGLIWLNMDWQTCRNNLLSRGPQDPDPTDPAALADFEVLIEYASNYWLRTGPRSFSGHQALFDRFGGRKLILRERRAIDALLADYASLL